MPLPSDEKLIQLGNDLIEQFDTIFGLHPGFRPAHAKAVLLTIPACRRRERPLKALALSDRGVPRHASGRPRLRADPKPSPSSFAKEAYFGVTALRFINKDGA